LDLSGKALEESFDIFVNFTSRENRSLLAKIPDHLQRSRSSSVFLKAGVSEKEYVSALCAEIPRKAHDPAWQRRPVRSVYLGAGAFPHISALSLDKVLTVIGRSFPVLNDVRVTLECSPLEMSREFLAHVRLAGVNSIIMRNWSFVPATLKTIGCGHSSSSSVRGYYTARDLDFSMVGVDITFAVPSQTVSEFRRDLDAINILKPDHVSAYPLHVYAGNSFYKSIKRKLFFRKKLVPFPLRERMKRVLDRTLEFGGYRSYQIYDFVREGREALYHFDEWHGRDFLGIGAGGFSRFVGQSGEREQRANSSNPSRYVSRTLYRGRSDGVTRKIPLHDNVYEYVSSQLRKPEGLRIDEFSRRFSAEFDDVYPGLLEILKRNEYVNQEGGSVYLTAKGVVVAENVIEGFRCWEREVRRAI